MSNKTNQDNFAEYLGQKRESLALSQEGLAEELTARSSVFDGVDAATISRWERAKVKPTLRRKVELVLFFGDDPYELRHQLGLTLDGDKKLQSFTNILDNELSYNHYIGAHPYLPKRTQYYDKVVSPPKTNSAWPQLIANYHQNISRGKENWSSSRLAELQEHPTTKVVYYLVDGELGGHIIMLRIKQTHFDNILNGHIEDCDIDTSMLAEGDQPYSFYNLTSYGGSRDIAEDGLKEQFSTLFLDQKFLYFGMKLRNDLGSKVLGFFDNDAVHKGPKTTEKNHGVKMGSARYEYVSHRISREAVYASKLSLYLID